MSYTLKNVYAPAPAVNRGKPTLLGGDPKGENILYCCGNSVVIRSLKDPSKTELYTQHQTNTTCARYAPSGFYIASGDANGNVRIWDTTQAEHVCKLEIRPLAGAILDMDWSPDSKRVVVVGEGREKFGAAFFMDSGASVGEITGHAKACTSVAFRQTRPFRVATGSEDLNIGWFEGPPFKWKFSISGHTRFVNCVRFSPQGEVLLSVGQDKKGFLYDGKTGEKKGELSADGAHKGGIYSCSWNADGSKVLTASGDKTCKIWDMNTQQVISTFEMGKRTEDQQLGCLWQGDYLIGLSLGGDLSYLDVNNPTKPIQVLKGHNKFVTALGTDGKNVYTGAYDSKMYQWDIETAIATEFEGKGHSNQINGIKVANDTMYSCSMDDSMRVTPTNGLSWGDHLSADSPVADIAVSGDVSVSVSMKSIYVIQGGAIASTTACSYQPTSVSVSNDKSTVLVGGDDNKIHVYSLSGTSLTAGAELEGHRGDVTCIAHSPDGKYFASSCKQREIFVWENNEIKIRGWVFHTARVQSVAWSPDSLHVASGALDSNVIVWDVTKPSKRIQIKGAHHLGVNAVAWIDNNTVASCGQDCSWKTHTINF